MTDELRTFAPEQERNIAAIMQALDSISRRKPHERDGIGQYISDSIAIEGVGECELTYSYQTQHSTVEAGKQMLIVTTELRKKANRFPIANRHYEFIQRPNGDIRITSGMMTDGPYQHNGIGAGMLLSSDNAIRLTINMTDALKDKNIYAEIVDDARGMEPDNAGKMPNRGGWTSAIVKSRMKEYKEILPDSGIFTHVYQGKIINYT